MKFIALICDTTVTSIEINKKNPSNFFHGHEGQSQLVKKWKSGSEIFIIMNLTFYLTDLSIKLVLIK